MTTQTEIASALNQGTNLNHPIVVVIAAVIVVATEVSEVVNNHSRTVSSNLLSNVEASNCSINRSPAKTSSSHRHKDQQVSSLQIFQLM
jgi:hypothetical protein